VALPSWCNGSGHDVVEPPLTHVLIEGKWSAIKHVHRLHRPSEITILDALETGHIKNTAQLNIELTEVQWLLLKSLVGLGDHYFDNPLLREENLEERGLVQVCNLIPPSVLEFSLNIGNSCGSTGTYSWLFPLAGCIDLLGDCLGAGILGCWLVIVFNKDPLLTELVDLLRRLCSQRTLSGQG
jgi:hypothetical protein